MEGFQNFKEYIDFIEKWENVVLISFGTTYQPTHSQFMNLLEATRKVDFTGFIVSIENEKLLKDASALGLTNTLIKSSVPQKELLALPKVKLIVTHCEGP